MFYLLDCYGLERLLFSTALWDLFLVSHYSPIVVFTVRVFRGHLYYSLAFYRYTNCVFLQASSYCISNYVWAFGDYDSIVVCPMATNYVSTCGV